MNRKISVITICLNSESTIKRTIESVLGQSYNNIEYIIIDGLSSDATVTIAESYKEKFANKGISLTIISEKDDGLYYAYNKGIKKATGDIIGLLNSDDWYSNDTLEKVNRFYENTQFDLMYAAARIYRSNGGSFIKHPRKRKYTTSRDWNHPTMFVTKEIYCENLYNTKYFYADFDFWIRMRKKKINICILEEVLTNFSVGGVSNKKNVKAALKRCKDRFSVYRDNDLSWLYIFECIFMELGKLVLA